MKLLSAIRSVAALTLTPVLMAVTGLGQSPMESGQPASGTPTPTRFREPDVAARAFPRADLGSERELKYVGSYCSDGKFRRQSRLDRRVDRTVLATPEAATAQGARPSEVPPWVQLGSSERIVDDIEPPGHSVTAARGHCAIAEARDGILRFVYGREKVLRAPRHLTTDSKQRLIISDPAVPALHVLDLKGKKSFRIVGGQGRRLHLPNGVAVDSEDNIYVADSERGMVFVYDSDGRYLHSVGDLGGGEGLFYYPTSIAIDRKAGRLYVLDSSRLFMLDLEGNILKRTGKLRGDTRPFSNPTDIVLGEQELLVLDTSGERVHIMDLQCNLLRTLSLYHVPMSHDIAVGVDHDGNIYASFADASVIRVYNHQGTLLSSFGHSGIRIGEFNHPTGLWIDSTSRIYVADTGNLRIQVFQLPTLDVKTAQAMGSH